MTQLSFRATCRLVKRRIANIVLSSHHNSMNFKVIVHKAEEGGYWAEVPSIPGCVSQGESMDELKENVQEAIHGCLSVEIDEPQNDPESEIIELAL